MPAIVVRNLAEATHRALKARAAANSRSTEAEVRAILEAAVAPPGRVLLGSLLAAMGAAHDGVELDVRRSSESSEPVDLG